MAESSGATRLILVRHGESVWHADNRYAGGGSDIDLTDRGRRQAQALAAWAGAGAVGALVSSPVRRARETAAPTALALGLEPEIIDDLREVDFGVAEGHTVEELLLVNAAMVHRFRADPVANPYPGSESPATAAERAGAALLAVARRHSGERVLVVAHNTLIRLALCRLLDLPVSRYRQLFPRLDNAARTEVEVPSEGGPSSLICLNNTIDPPVS